MASKNEQNNYKTVRIHRTTADLLDTTRAIESGNRAKIVCFATWMDEVCKAGLDAIRKEKLAR